MDVDLMIELLRKGERVKCENCQEGYYVTTAKPISISREFSCEKCGSVVRISPHITVE